MPAKRLKRFKREINQFGFYNFIFLKITEQHYKNKFKKMGVTIPRDREDLAPVNQKTINNDALYNDSTQFYVIKKGLDVTGIRYQDIQLLDIGCGYGKVLNFGMLLKFKQVIGLDLCSNSLKVASNGCNKMHRHGYNSTDYKVLHTDACEYKIPKGINVIFLANPFGKKTMETVLKNIISYFHENKNDVYIIYAVPVHNELFMNKKECKKIFENFNGNKRIPEIIVYKICSNRA